MTIGFVGLGIMGAPMAANLLKNGYDLVVNDIDSAAVEKLTERGAVYGDYDAVGQCEVIFLILPSGKICKSVLFEAGLAEKIAPGSILCDLSSQLPEEAAFAAEELGKRGVRYADAPVSGGEPKAISGELSIMVGAAEEDFRILFPVLMAMGKQITHMGKVGAGNATKLANQIITNVNIGAIAEAVNLAGKAGITPEKLFEAIRNGAAGSAMLNTRAEKIVQRNYKPGAKISINKKDLGNVLAYAESEGLTLPLAQAYYQTLCRLSDRGLDGLDVSAVPEHYFDA